LKDAGGKGSLVFPERGLKTLGAFIKSRNYSRIFVLCDTNTARFCLSLLKSSCQEIDDAVVIRIPAGETSKTITSAVRIWKTLLKEKADRHSLLVNLGGGMITDLGAFSASLYKRGIDFIHIPTSLLAMVDAAIGNKTGIDLENVRNAVGNFSAPQKIFIQPDFLNTLPEKNKREGLAEMMKIAVVAGPGIWRSITGPVRDEKMSVQLIQQCIDKKLDIVSRDPFDNHQRKLLNFGHTIGHAIEGLALKKRKKLTHGEAIAAGMLMETHIAERKGILSKKAAVEIGYQLQYQLHPLVKPFWANDELFAMLAQDKKNKNGKFLFVLPTGIGKARSGIAVSKREIASAVVFYRSLYAEDHTT
jgi:3-dehydroquinate synthase